mmetsp:Transcript_8905/g.40445  ORF Transcript_8905/g.40445 Transcript_8905/m.40445 type:complete len:286 (+) Transcript_8905:372-1229(+)
MVHEYERNHALHHGHRPRHDARIVPSLRLELDVHAVPVHGVLRLGDGARGLERNLELDDLAVGDPALDPAAPVGPGADARFGVHVELVVVLATRGVHAVEPAANLETLRRGQREHSLGEVRLQLVKHRRAEPARATPDDASHHAAARVTLDAHLVDRLDHGVRARLVRAPRDVALDVLHRERRVIHAGCSHVLHLGHVRENLGAGDLRKDLLGDGARGDAADGLTRGGPAAARDGANAVLHVVGGIRVRRSVRDCDLAVILRSVIFVADEHGDWRAQCDAVEADA